MVPQLNSGANAAPTSVQVLLALMLAVVALRTGNRVLDIKFLRWGQFSFEQKNDSPISDVNQSFTTACVTGIITWYV